MKRALQLILIGLTAFIAGGSSTPQAARHPAVTHNNATAELWPLEVRIRKMHLVRPDLLHYPIEYDVYC